MTAWKPPSTPPERISRALRSMSSGTLNGRIVSAMPINSPINGTSSSDEDDQDFGSDILPWSDYFTMSTGSSLVFKLKYTPYTNDGVSNISTFHVYWNNVYQKESTYTLSGNVLTLSDPAGLIRSGDVITVKYWYDANYPVVEDTSAVEIVRFSGPPTHFYKRSGAHGFYTYEEAVAEGVTSTWLDWLIANCAISSDGTMSYSTPPSKFPTGHDYEPAWILPTNGRQCRFSVDNLAYTTYPQFWSISLNFAVATIDHVSTTYGSFPDLLAWDGLYYDFTTANTDSYGANEKEWRGWYDSVGIGSYIPSRQATSFPSDASAAAISFGDLGGFQKPPYESTTPQEWVSFNYESGDDPPVAQRAFVAFYMENNFWRPVDHEYTDYTFTMTGIHMVRE